MPTYLIELGAEENNPSPGEKYMEAKVSASVLGTLIISSVSKKSFVANQVFELTEQQYWESDVQAAINSGLIICKSVPKAQKTFTITNIGTGSISIPNFGILQSGKTIKLPHEMKESKVILKLEDLGKIEFVGKLKQEVPVVKITKVKVNSKKSKQSKTRKIQKVGKTEDMIIDMDAPEKDETDDSIVWVDQEETKRRIASHPVLNKKVKAAEESDVMFVDHEDTKRRIANNPAIQKANAKNSNAKK